MAAGSHTSRGRARRRRRTMAVVAVIAVVGWLAYATVNIMAPTQGDRSATVDAVISLAPQQNRLPVAQELIAAGVSDTLLISYFAHDSLNHRPGTGQGDHIKRLSTYCDEDGAVETICFTPTEDATIGEVHAIDDIAAEHSWEAVTVVTDSFHTFRTRYILAQCLHDDLQVNVVFAEQDLSPMQWVWHAVYENAAFIKAVWQTSTRC